MPRIFIGLLLILVTKQVTAMQVAMVATNATCNYASGYIHPVVSGGMPPYTYAWADGPTTLNRDGLLPGMYSLTVTDALSDEVTETVEIYSMPYELQTYQPYSYCGVGGQFFPMDIQMPVGSNGPWSVNGMPMELAPGSLDTYAFYPDTWNYNVTIEDGNDCTGTLIGTLGQQITTWPTLTVTGVEPSCTNEAIGAIHISSSGPAPGMGFGDTFLHLIRDDGTPMYMTSPVDPFTLEAHFTNVPPGNFLVHWWLGYTLDNLDPGTCAYDTVAVTIPSLADACGNVEGTSWYDADGDCIHDPNEVGIPFSPLEIQPGGDIVLTGVDGTFDIPLLDGNYTLEQIDPFLIPYCPGVQPVPLTVSGNTTVLQLANGSTQPLDLRATLSNGAARPGFNFGIHYNVRNMSPQASGPVTVTATIDPLLIYNSAVPTPTNVSGNTITWQLAAFNSYQSNPFTVNTQVPFGTVLGTVLQQAISVSNTLPDADPTNDAETLYTTVTGSVDPNDKAVRTSSGNSDTQYFLGTDNWMDYTIRFQNTGTDTAFTVVVTDTLPEALDMLTFQQGATSHLCDVAFRTGRVVEWRFSNILLPDSNTNEAASHGLLRFRIRPHEPLLPATVISNNADIFFDYNTAVRTNDAVLIAEFSTGIATHTSTIRSVVANADNLMVYATGDAIRASTLRVLTMDGHTAFATGPLTIDRNGIVMDITSLSNGCYMVCALNTDGSIWNQRFVK